MTPPMLYRIQEAMRLLSVSRATIYRMIQRGDLVAIKLGAATRITADSIEKVVSTPEHAHESRPP